MVSESDYGSDDEPLLNKHYSRSSSTLVDPNDGSLTELSDGNLNENSEPIIPATHLRYKRVGSPSLVISDDDTQMKSRKRRKTNQVARKSTTGPLRLKTKLPRRTTTSEVQRPSYTALPNSGSQNARDPGTLLSPATARKNVTTKSDNRTLPGLENGSDFQGIDSSSETGEVDAVYTDMTNDILETSASALLGVEALDLGMVMLHYKAATGKTTRSRRLPPDTDSFWAQAETAGVHIPGKEGRVLYSDISDEEGQVMVFENDEDDYERLRRAVERKKATDVAVGSQKAVETMLQK